MYCAWYGFGRGFIELLRTDSLMLGPIKVSCLLGFLVSVASITAIVIIRRKIKPEAEYVSVFSENMEGNEDEAN